MDRPRFEAEAMPARIRRLPIDRRGYPVPAFVAKIPGQEPGFRVVDQFFKLSCIKHKRCWICGDPLGVFLCFVIGPMCAINRVSSEPPSHADCAAFSVKACPFLSNPQARRPQRPYLQGHEPPPGIHIERNPGCALIWVTKSFQTFGDRRDPLIMLGEPIAITAWAQGRKAQGAEIDHSVQTGLPLLEAAAQAQGLEAIAALAKQVQAFADLKRKFQLE